MVRRRQKRYTPEFIAKAVRLAAESETPIATIARELGVAPKTLRTWHWGGPGRSRASR